MHKEKLNSEQIKAIRHGEGPCMVIAGPGSGKTTVITKRIQFLIQEKHIPPEQILVITFTKAAAIEMEQRFLILMNDSYYPVTFGTFHSFFLHILQLSTKHMNLTVLDEKEKKKLLSEILTLIGIPNEEHDICSNYYFLQMSRKHNSYNQKTKIHQPVITEPLNEEQIIRIKAMYEKRKRNMGKVDFDDMEVLCERVLKDNPLLLQDITKKYQYILVDEFQDINDKQFEILRFICSKTNNMFVVGDDDQSIYGFRGSKPNIMLELPKIYPELKQIVLNTNYRSNEEITKMSKELIVQNKHRFEKHIESVHKEGEGVEICLLENRSDLKEELTARLKSNSENMQIAVICRTNQELTQLKGQLLQEGISVKIYKQKSNVITDMVLQDIITYLELSALHAKYGNYSRELFIRIMNKPKRYLGRHSIFQKYFVFDDIREYYDDKPYMKKIIFELETMLLKIETMDFYSAIWYIRKKGGYDRYLLEFCKEKKVDITQILAVLEQFQKTAKTVSSLEKLREWVEEQKERTETPENAVYLLTYHGSKGLEFDTVILPNLNEGFVPHKKNEDIEEERRMLYVAMTRAKKKLILMAWKSEGGKESVISRFLQEIIKKKSR